MVKIQCQWLISGVMESLDGGHHHNADQAARRPHILCSICVHSCSLRHFTISQLSSNVLYWHFRNLQPVGWNLKSGLFDSPAPRFEDVWRRGVEDGPIPFWHTWSISTVFELLSWLQKRLRPSVQPGHDDKYRWRSYRVVERQKWQSGACDIDLDLENEVKLKRSWNRSVSLGPTNRWNSCCSIMWRKANPRFGAAEFLKPVHAEWCIIDFK